MKTGLQKVIKPKFTERSAVSVIMEKEFMELIAENTVNGWGPLKPLPMLVMPQVKPKELSVSVSFADLKAPFPPVSSTHPLPGGYKPREAVDHQVSSPSNLMLGFWKPSVKTLARSHREASLKGRKQSHSGDLVRTRWCRILHIHQRERS